MSANAWLPTKFWVQAPVASCSQQHCAGVFALQQDLANGKPLWKKTDGEVWIYANKHGHWCLGGADAKFHAFDWNRCYFYQEESQLPCDLRPWHAWNQQKQCWLPCDLRVSEVAFADEQQRVTAAQGEVQKLRIYAELRIRRRQDWWRPPAPPARPLPPGASEDTEHDIMAQRAAGLGQLGINLCTPLFDEGSHTLLMLAAEQGWTQLCRQLCSTCGSTYLDAQEDETGYTALFYATREGHLDVVQVLLEAKASPNVSSTRAGATPLLLAATAAPNTSMLRQLLEARAAVPPRRHIEKLAKNEEVRCMLIEALPKSKAPRRRTVMYEKEEQLKITWFCSMGEIFVRSLGSKEKAYEAGVRPGWTLRLVDGKAVTKIDQLQPPVELQFQRPVDLPEDFWQGHLAELIDGRQTKGSKLEFRV